MALYAPPTYIYSMVDIAGVVLANNFLSLMNPVGSGKTYLGLQLLVSTYSGSLTGSLNSLTPKRITSASGGTLIAASTIPRFDTAYPNPVTEVRIDNPTVGGSGLALTPVAPVISTGAGQSSMTLSPPTGTVFVIRPGEGAVITTAGGDIDQIWNITAIWQEVGS